MLDAGEIIMVGAMYDVKTGIVTFLDVPDELATDMTMTLQTAATRD